MTENGYGKRTECSQYRKQTRGGKGILAMRLTEKNGAIAAIRPVNEGQDLMIITDKGQVIRTSISGISLMGRTTQGVRIIRLKDGLVETDEINTNIKKLSELKAKTASFID